MIVRRRWPLVLLAPVVTMLAFSATGVSAPSRQAIAGCGKTVQSVNSVPTSSPKIFFYAINPKSGKPGEIKIYSFQVGNKQSAGNLARPELRVFLPSQKITHTGIDSSPLEPRFIKPHVVVNSGRWMAPQLTPQGSFTITIYAKMLASGLLCNKADVYVSGRLVMSRWLPMSIR